METNKDNSTQKFPEYNSQLKKLILPEYGRNLQMMVELIKKEPRKEERNRMAQGLINVMGMLNPHLRDVNDFKHKLWDHLFIMAEFDLDIDCPYEKLTPQKLAEKPKKLEYNQHRINFKYYGRIVENLIERAISYPEGYERNGLIVLIANHMKKQYLIWNKETVEDELILEHIRQISKGQLDPKSMRLTESREILNKNRTNNNYNNNYNNNHNNNYNNKMRPRK